VRFYSNTEKSVIGEEKIEIKITSKSLKKAIESSEMILQSLKKLISSK